MQGALSPHPLDDTWEQNTSSFVVHEPRLWAKHPSFLTFSDAAPRGEVRQRLMGSLTADETVNQLFY